MERITEIKNVYELEKIIEDDYNRLIKKLKDNLISIFIIGSMVDKNKTLVKYNDYDIRILTKKIDKKTYNTIKDFNIQIKNKLEKEGIDTEYSFLVGPVRHITKSKINLLLHCLPMTEKSLDELPLTHKYSYSQNYRIIFGKDILKKYEKIKYSANDIIFCTEGIDYCLEMVNNNVLYYLEWKEYDENMQLVKQQKNMDEYMLFEVLRYSISKSVDNIIRMMMWNKNFTVNGINEKILMIDNTINEQVLNKLNRLLHGSFDEFINNKNEYIYITKYILKKVRRCIIENEEIL